jgi:hypothetical protein
MALCQRLSSVQRGPTMVVPDSTSPDIQGGTVPLVESHRVQLDLVRALAAMTDVEWLGSVQASPADHDDWRRVSTILALPIADGSAPGPVRKGALVDLGPAEIWEQAIEMEVSWQSDSMAPLFPVFAGRLRIDPTGLFLEGRYAPPFGRLGLLIDAGILRFIARRTAQAFLTRLADRIVG